MEQIDIAKFSVNEPIEEITTVIGRNFTGVDELASWIRGLIGRGISGWHNPAMVIKDVRSVTPFFHKFDDLFDVVAIVVLQPEEVE